MNPESGSISLPALSSLSMLFIHFDMTFRISYLISTEKTARILIEVVLNSEVILERLGIISLSFSVSCILGRGESGLVLCAGMDLRLPLELFTG